YVTYESADGMEIGALLYDARDRPVGSEDEVTPGVVKVHGGPHGQSMQSFDLYAQFLVSQGYSVLLPNYRGSIGRGREFQQSILGDWGGAEQEDVAAGGHWLGDREFVDADRLAVFGGSYGGYSAYCQLTMHPEIWTTGVAWIGITDLELLYEESMPHFQAMLEQQLGDPEENAERWRDRSPITHVGNMQAPVFVVHGVNDPRCPISQARTFRDALQERGWEAGPDDDFEYEELEAEGHGSSDVEQKVRAFGLIGEFLERRL
ncbi:MAG: alpha/beta hydrolase family protein, partial [Halolamina sp.]